MTVALPAAAAGSKYRIRVFIDYWNFQLSLNEKDAARLGQSDSRFTVDWRGVGPWLAKQACAVLGCEVANHSFEGCIIYTSYSPSSTEGTKFKNWVTNWLDRQPGVQVYCRERKPRSAFRCPECHSLITGREDIRRAAKQ